MAKASTVQVTTPTDREVVVRRDFNAPRHLVFKAYTQCEYVSRWLIGPPGWTMVYCDMDLRVGGKYRHVLRGPNDRELAWGGEFREIVPPELLVTQELFDEDWTGGPTLITARFDEQDGRTTLTITVLYSSKEARDGALATGMTDGMAMSYDRMDGVLASMQG